MSSPSSPDDGVARRGVALLGSTGSIGGQAVEVLAAHPELFRVVALATRSNASALRDQADRLGRRSRWSAALATTDLVELATRDDVDLVVVGTGGIVSLRPVLAALAGRQGRRDRKQGDARRRWPPGHAGGAPVGGSGRGGAPRRRVRQPACLAAADRFRAFRALAMPGRRIDGVGRCLDPDRLGRPVPRRRRGPARARDRR